MLRELKKGEKVLVIGNDSENPSGTHGHVIGSLAKVDIPRHIDGTCRVLGKNLGQWLMRKDLLCVGDKVVRGPDCTATLENIKGVVKKIAAHEVLITWTTGQNGWHKVKEGISTILHDQDLKPTGESEGEGDIEGKPECWGTHKCSGVVCNDCPRNSPGSVCECGQCKESITSCKESGEKYKPTEFTTTISKEDTMSRSAEKRELKEVTIPKLTDEVAEAELALDTATKKLARLTAHDTEHAETIADIMLVKGVEEAQAEGILRLSKGVGIT